MAPTNSCPEMRPALPFTVSAKLIGWFFLICASVWMQAQVETGRIVGAVKDASGAVVSSATITVTAIQINVQSKTTTNADGEYVIAELNAGEYTVSVEHAGFKKAVQAAFKLDVNQVVRIDFVLT